MKKLSNKEVHVSVMLTLHDLQAQIYILHNVLYCFLHYNTVETRYNEVLGTKEINLIIAGIRLYQGKKQKNIKSWDQQNHLVITDTSLD